MYKHGDLTLLTPPCETYDMEEEDCTSHEWGEHRIMDSRKNERVLWPAVYLPHSCDEWVIGGSKEIQALIDDLQAALRKLTREE